MTKDPMEQTLLMKKNDASSTTSAPTERKGLYLIEGGLSAKPAKAAKKKSRKRKPLLSLV